MRLTTHYQLCMTCASILLPVSSHWDQPVSMTLEWIYIKHWFCTVLTCLSFQYVKLACSYFPHKLQHWDTLRGFYWGKSQLSKKIWTRDKTDDSHAPWTNKSTFHTSRESAAMIKNTVKNVSLFSTVIRADNNGPNMKCCSKVVLNVQAAMTWYTRMCKDMKGKVNLAMVFWKRKLNWILEYCTILHSR